MYTMARILPMDREYEFENTCYKIVQDDFFLKDLPSRKDNNGQGKYCYKKNGMNANEGSTLVLFQYDNQIIACADLDKIIKLEQPKNVYFGAFYFEPNSIKIFEPISNEQINKIFNCTKKFGQVKHTLDINYISDFMNSLKNVKFVDADLLEIDEKPTFIPNIKNED